jgi:hypothetical protein
VKKFVSITSILMCSIVYGAPPNPLLGKWKLVNPTAPSQSYCNTAMAFTNTTQTFTHSAAMIRSTNIGKVESSKVTYNATQTSVYPTTVYVLGDAGMHMTYLFSSKDRLVVDTADQCKYQRD